MSALEIIQIPVFDDNYVYLLHEPIANKTAVVDPALSEPVLEVLKEKGWTLDFIINTHHHFDHVGGNLELKEATGCTIVGSDKDVERIPGIDVEVKDGDTFTLGEQTAQVFDVPGHTRAHIAYWFEDSDALFCGDTLFSMGCGRLFEGSPQEMWSSLQKLSQLPDQTKVYCAHEYTASNGKFALSIDASNTALIARMAEVEKLRAKNLPTVPSLLGVEKQTNPFLRANDASLAQAVGLSGESADKVFAEIRTRKDNA
ncbi:MAG: hydroxyacylglutathione hydrolase [Sphingomonadales bacterium]|nr:hydroxyacylglutathione hydrolase [Sphingomonadales bacterium]